MNAANLRRAANEIKEAYPYHVPNDFKITSLFIVTWEEVGYYDQKNDKVISYCSFMFMDIATRVVNMNS